MGQGFNSESFLLHILAKPQAHSAPTGPQQVQNEPESGQNELQHLLAAPES